jgi:hypothetical protein
MVWYGTMVEWSGKPGRVLTLLPAHDDDALRDNDIHEQPSSMPHDHANRRTYGMYVYSLSICFTYRPLIAATVVTVRTM